MRCFNLVVNDLLKIVREVKEVATRSCDLGLLGEMRRTNARNNSCKDDYLFPAVISWNVNALDVHS